MNTKLVQTNGKEPMKTLSGNVTADIIIAAQPRHQNRCMVALSLQEKYPTATSIFVDSSTMRITLNGLRYWFIPPQSVKDHIINYDKKAKDKTKRPIVPFKFVTAFRARVTPSGFWQTHKSDNRTDPSKKYDPAKKKRKYGKRVRVHGVTCYCD